MASILCRDKNDPDKAKKGGDIQFHGNIIFNRHNSDGHLSVNETRPLKWEHPSGTTLRGNMKQVTFLP